MQKTSLYTITVLAVALLTGLAIFQLLLILGVPLGRAAWGGSHTVLPLPFRVGSAVTIVVYLVAIRAITARAGLRKTSPVSKFARMGTWFFGIFFLLSGLLNFATQNPWERNLMAPIALALGLLFLLVAKSRLPERV